MRRKRPENRKRSIIVLLILLLIFSVLTGSVVLTIKSRIGPNVEEVGKLRAKVMVSQIINKALNDLLYENNNMEELLIRQSGSDGQMEILQANTQAMNLLATELASELQAEYADRKVDVYSVPAGVLLGDRLLSQTNLEVDLRIMPLSVSSLDFKTEFESQGINQTKYKVYLVMESEVKVLAPFAEETFMVTTTVPVAEAVILGNVPDSYVNVPEEDILDVTSE